jgi:hypothetical protein
MKFLSRTVGALLVFSTGLLAFQGGGFRRPFTPSQAYDVGGDSKHEFAWSRLEYTPLGGSFGGFGGYGRGGGAGSWSRDYPKADITFLAALRRLTRIDARSYQQVVDLNSDAIFNFPFVYAVQVQSWTFTDQQAARLRDYLLKGGFLMVDDFHGAFEWDVFTQSMSRIFPDRVIVELPDADPIFHTVYDLDQRVQVPGLQYLYSGRICEKCENGGKLPHWRAIYDDDGRVMVAMCFNQDDGDAWEHADNPQYETKYTSQAYRLGINYVIYAMTH